VLCCSAAVLQCCSAAVLQCCSALQTQRRQNKTTCKFGMTKRVHPRPVHGSPCLCRCCGLDAPCAGFVPSFYRTQNPHRRSNGIKAFTVRGLICFSALEKARRRKSSGSHAPRRSPYLIEPTPTRPRPNEESGSLPERNKAFGIRRLIRSRAAPNDGGRQGERPGRRQPRLIAGNPALRDRGLPSPRPDDRRRDWDNPAIAWR